MAYLHKTSNFQYSAPRTYPLNEFRHALHLPSLPEGNIIRIAFYRRKPKGFSNGHYLQVNPSSMVYSPRVRRNIVLLYGGCFCFFWSVLGMQQYKARRWWFGEKYEPAYFTEEYLEKLRESELAK